ncbi:RNA polymerase sigma factor [Pedobacter metabolipauper]|uniref:RNA polymerase sigma-70 factor (ECF subfamily) n=1 Tax=Pedobacter metabolipauper TaxID=425513 RepID=A0A4R6SVP1_9SPHI|nr:sigma-70 family RNA polymerase sigma factor [Pedobacter metabolipauper]TDQ09451.1 RNA polymerase sigma-70 factor (ECF subfamily) [Pedobacter metabolipauper]
MKKLSDEELFMLIRQDDERAFSTLFDRYKTLLYRHIYQRIKSETEAEEILQDIFISIWKNRQTIVISDSLLPYLLGAAKKCVFALYARTSKKIEHTHLLKEMEPAFEYPAEEFIMARELETIMDNEVQNMPQTMRLAFQLSRKEHISVREIAERLSISEQTVKNNITMALQRLRGKLNAKYMIQLIPFMLFFY